MNNRLFKYIAPAALGAVLMVGGLTSCSDELEQSVIDEQTNTTLDKTGLLAFSAL